MVDRFPVGYARASRRILCQGRQQIAAAIRAQRARQGLLFGTRQLQIRRVDHPRIIKAPLQEVVRDESGRLFRCLPRIHHRLFAVGQGERARRRAKLHPAIHHGDRRPVRVIRRQQKFRAFNTSDRPTGIHMDAARLIAMKEGNDAVHQIDPGLIVVAGRGQDLQFGAGSEGDHALIGPAQSHAAVGPGADMVGGMQQLIRLAQRPGRTPGGLHFHHPLGLGDDDGVQRRRRSNGRRLRPTHLCSDDR